MGRSRCSHLGTPLDGDGTGAAPELGHSDDKGERPKLGQVVPHRAGSPVTTGSLLELTRGVTERGDALSPTLKIGGGVTGEPLWRAQACLPALLCPCCVSSA